MLQEVTLRNFKSFAHATAPIAPFTLLVGANASGKSNFVEALRFLLGQGWTVLER
jgi:AAA15 family ATPase/GTPase